MLTAKWCYEADGISRERVFETDAVEMAYDNRPARGSSAAKLGVYDVPSHGVVVVGNPCSGADSLALTFGKVYVMNGDGKTVGTYHLAKEFRGAAVGLEGEVAPDNPSELSR